MGHLIVSFVLNGDKKEMELSGDERVLDLLRNDMGFTGCREGCGSGECGACTILVDGVSRLGCLMKSAQLEGCNVVTIEGIRDDQRYRPLFDAFASSGAVQCGYCTPGMILASVALLLENPDPSEEEIRRGLSGNICRCTGYSSIVSAVMEGAIEMRKVDHES